MSATLACNGKRLGDVAAFENHQTEPKPNRITNNEDKHKSSIVKVQPGLKPNSEQKDEHIFVAPPYCQTACCMQAYIVSLLMSILKWFFSSLGKEQHSMSISLQFSGIFLKILLSLAALVSSVTTIGLLAFIDKEYKSKFASGVVK